MRTKPNPDHGPFCGLNPVLVLLLALGGCDGGGKSASDTDIDALDAPQDTLLDTVDDTPADEGADTASDSDLDVLTDVPDAPLDVIEDVLDEDASADVPADETAPDPSCGDGITQPERGEQCDDSTSNSDTEPNACRTDCTLAHCGDRVTDTGEECDDGNDVDNDECSNGCVEVLVFLCSPCTADGECARAVDLCTDMLDGSFCTVDCTGGAPCPGGFTCMEIWEDVTLLGTQCVPDDDVCLGCHDPDGDDYGIGIDCIGMDCDESSDEVNPGAAESCNGVDDDCDCDEDEDFVQLGFACDGADADQCLNGTFTCTGDGADVECVNESVHMSESCNDRDDDCDSEIDEGFPDSDGDTTMDCVDEDDDDDGEPDITDCSPLDALVWPSAVEACDGLDNNCNAQVDEGCADLDHDGIPDVMDDDDDGDGDPDTTDCDPRDPDVYHGAPEICDLLDNDCDGATDEDDIDTDSDTVADCADSDDDGDGDPDVSDCEPWNDAAHHGATEVCDYLDNDCDGTTDEGFPDLGTSCDGTDADLCANGTRTCTWTGTGTECVNEYATNLEICNGIDDDCDGYTDADDALDLLAHDEQPCEDQQGVCSGSTKPADLCIAGSWAVCGPNVYTDFSDYEYEFPVESSCDFRDNDCNGIVDDMTQWDTENCSECGQTCDYAGATEVCMGGTCIPTGCVSGRSDCDGNTSNGCELNHATYAPTIFLGAVCGDCMWCGPSCECGWGGTTLATAHNNRSQKFQMIVSECSDWDVEVAFYVRLNTSGTSMDFDLMLWQCDDASFSAGCYVRDVAADTGLVKKDGHCFFDTWGEDDTTFWIVEVKYDLADSSGASCNDWTLEVRGHDDDFARIGHSWCP